MIKKSDLELKELHGGMSITGTIVNGFVSLIELLYDAGKSAGSAIRRLFDGDMCPLKLKIFF